MAENHLLAHAAAGQGAGQGLAGTACLCSTRWWLAGLSQGWGPPPSGATGLAVSGTPPFPFVWPLRPRGLFPPGQRCPLQEVLATCGYLHRKQYRSKLLKEILFLSYSPRTSTQESRVAAAPAGVGLCLGPLPQQVGPASSPGADSPLTHSRASGSQTPLVHSTGQSPS